MSLPLHLLLLPTHPLRPTALLAIIGFGILFTSIAIYIDTSFYKPTATTLEIISNPIITPLNNILYNTDPTNLAIHGLHPHYQHFLANLPQLLGPAYIAMILSLFNWPLVPNWMRNARALSALSATALLSIFPHQEPRFLLPCVPLLLSCMRMHRSRLFLGTWLLFNLSLGFLMGIYHQGGIVPTQLAMRSIVASNTLAQGIKSPLPDTTVFWWKTYSPPSWLLGPETNTSHITTIDLMGLPALEMISHLDNSTPGCQTISPVYLVAPTSATFLDPYTTPSSLAHPHSPNIQLYRLWTHRKHINLDDLDFGDDGVLTTLKRVVGRRGLAVWSVRRACQ